MGKPPLSMESRKLEAIVHFENMIPLGLIISHAVQVSACRKQIEMTHARRASMAQNGRSELSLYRASTRLAVHAWPREWGSNTVKVLYLGFCLAWARR